MNHNPLTSIAIIATVIGGIAVDLSAAESVVRVSNRDEFVNALAAAKPGTTILLAPGTYRGGISRASLRGTAEQPITIAAADPQQPPVIEGGGSGLHLSAPAHLELRKLILTKAEGNGLNIDDGGSKEVPAHHIKLQGLVIRDVGPRGNRDGIKLSGVDDFVVEDCTVERWGSGGSGIDMVGCHQGVVTGCTFRNEGADAANGVQTKGGSSQITIRSCRFESAGGRALNIGGSTGLDYFRPKPQGYEAKDITVEDCTLIGSMAPIAFVGVDGAVVRHNTIYRPKRWGIRILQENQASDFVPSRNGRFEHNVVAFQSTELSTLVNIGPGTAPESFTFTENLWYCIDRSSATKDLIRLPVAEKNGRYGVDPEFVNADQGDFRLKNPKLVNAGVRETTEKGN